MPHRTQSPRWHHISVWQTGSEAEWQSSIAFGPWPSIWSRVPSYSAVSSHLSGRLISALTWLVQLSSCFSPPSLAEAWRKLDKARTRPCRRVSASQQSRRSGGGSWCEDGHCWILDLRSNVAVVRAVLLKGLMAFRVMYLSAKALA